MNPKSHTHTHTPLLVCSAFLLFICLTFMSSPLAAQVGINIDNPEDSCILHIKDDKRGVIFPNIIIESTYSPDLGPKLHGMLYFKKETSQFRFYNHSIKSFQTLNPWVFDANSNMLTNLAVNSQIKINTTLNTTQRTLLAVNERVIIESKEIKDKYNKSKIATVVHGMGTIPIGGIIMWSGDTIDIPDGWALCDGRVVNEKITPNLSGKFVLSYQPYKYPMKNSGGKENIVLNAANLPSHSHTAVALEDSHSHNSSYIFKGASISSEYGDVNVVEFVAPNTTGSHSVRTDQVSTYVSVTVNSSTGPASSTIGIIPPYFVLAYIMRVY